MRVERVRKKEEGERKSESERKGCDQSSQTSHPVSRPALHV